MARKRKGSGKQNAKGSNTTMMNTVEGRLTSIMASATGEVTSTRQSRTNQDPQRVLFDPIQELVTYKLPSPYNKVLANQDLDRIATYAAMIPHFPRNKFAQLYQSMFQWFTKDTLSDPDARTRFERYPELALAAADPSDTGQQVKAMVGFYQHYLYDTMALSTALWTWYVISSQHGYSISRDAASYLKFSKMNAAIASLDMHLPILNSVFWLPLAANPVCIANKNMGGYTLVIPQFLEAGQTFLDDPLVTCNSKDPKGVFSEFGIKAPIVPGNSLFEVVEGYSAPLNRGVQDTDGLSPQTLTYRKRVYKDFLTANIPDTTVKGGSFIDNIAERCLATVERFQFKYNGRAGRYKNMMSSTSRLSIFLKEMGLLDGEMRVSDIQRLASSANNNVIDWYEFLSSSRSLNEMTLTGLRRNNMADDTGYANGRDASFAPPFDSLEDNDYDKTTEQYILDSIEGTKLWRGDGSYEPTFKMAELPYVFQRTTDRGDAQFLIDSDLYSGNPDNWPNLEGLDFDYDNTINNPFYTEAFTIISTSNSLLHKGSKSYVHDPEDQDWVKTQLQEYTDKVYVDKELTRQGVAMLIPKETVLWNPLDMYQRSSSILLSSDFVNDESSFEFLISTLVKDAQVSEIGVDLGIYGTVDIAAGDFAVSKFLPECKNIPLWIGTTPDASPVQIASHIRACYLNFDGVDFTITGNKKSVSAEFMPVVHRPIVGYRSGIVDEDLPFPVFSNMSFDNDLVTDVSLTIGYGSLYSLNYNGIEREEIDAFEYLRPRMYGTRSYQYIREHLYGFSQIMSKFAPIQIDFDSAPSAEGFNMSPNTGASKGKVSASPRQDRDLTAGADSGDQPLTQGGNTIPGNPRQEEMDAKKKFRDSKGKGKPSSSRRSRKSYSSKPKSSEGTGFATDDKFKFASAAETAKSSKGFESSGDDDKSSSKPTDKRKKKSSDDEGEE